MGEKDKHPEGKGPPPGDRGTEGASGVLGSDRFYRAMAAEPRRRVLYHVLETDRSTLEELATVLTGWDAVESSRVESTDVRDQWKMELRHVHLPHLADVELLEYDQETGVVEATDLDPGVRDLVTDSVAASEH